MGCGLHGLNQIGNILAISLNGTPRASFKKSAEWVKFAPVVGLGTRDKTYLHHLKSVGQLAVVGPCVLHHRRPDQIGSKAVRDCAAGLLHLLTSGHSVGRLPNRNGAGHGDDQRHHGRAAGLLHRGAGGRAVGRLPHSERAGHADAGRHHGRAAGLPDPDQDVFTTNQITSALVAYRSAADQDTATASSIAAALLSYYTIAQVDGLLANKLGVTEAASALQIAVRFPDDGGADEAVAAIGEQILAPTDVSLSNWTVRPSVVLATHTAGVSVDGYTLTLAANPWNIVRAYNLTPGRELAARHGLQLRGVHVRG